MSSSSSVPRIQVFRPTMEEFKNFSKYIAKIESTGAHKAGLAKIIPPEGWCPRKGGYDDIDLMIPAPISQVVTGSQGLYQQINVQQKAMHVKEFQRLAESNKYKTPSHFDYEDLERKYWKNITFNPPIYGADVSGSLYDKGVDEFNIQSLNTILDMVKEDYEIQIEGVNTAYLYFGMWKTTFAWHTEDMDLYSINYLHFGAPKSWYVVPPEHGRRLERLATGYFHSSHQLCGAFLRHKMTIISPSILKTYSIPCSKITQEPGEFMITFPFGYHSGFNHGYNCAESTNFALPRWIEYGKRSSQCTCRNDCVKICMDVFVRKFQPERYELWKEGKDYGAHPEDPTKHYAAPPPNKMELAMTEKKKEKKKPKLMQKIKRHPISKLEKLQNKKKKESNGENAGDSEKVKKPKIKRTPKKKTVKKTDDKSFITYVQVGEKMNLDSDDTQILDFKTEGVESPPPELKPFWDPEDKAKLETEVKSEIEDANSLETVIATEDDTDVSKINYSQSEAEILDKFPQLKNAIDHGSLSVKLLDETEEEELILPDKKCAIETITAKFSDDTASFYNFELSSSIFAQNWRCEQVNNGLKIKFVSPKTYQFSGGQSPEEFPKIASVGECSVSYATEEIADEPGTSSKKSKLNSTDNATVKLYTKEGHSDSSFEFSPKVKRAANSVDNWAHPLTGLWLHENYNFETECKYNQKLASIPPHCAVCVIFSPIIQNNSFPSEPCTVPSASKVKMPGFCYADSLNSECVLDPNSLIQNDGSAPLLVCCSCKVCVHAPCYGITTMPSDFWICTRCSVEVTDAQCCLCVLRGGALKPTTDGRWAHIICAILISETFFEDTILKEPINISRISSNRQRLKCKYCFKTHAQKNRRGCCVQCQSGKCYLPFHVTCGYMAGVIFESSDWPKPINMICTKHSGARRKPVIRNFTSVSIGESVIAKHKKTRRYYWANVKQKYVQDYYSILFEDNSHSTNTLPEDIISRNVAEDGPPTINEKVKVKWTDNKIYNGIFKGSQTVDMFVVEFDDGSALHQERKEIFAADEDLPREVLSKMSHSSEGRSLNILVSDMNSKRVRQNSQKYYAM